MPLNPEALLALDIPDAEQILTDKDAILYALSLGLGDDPIDETELTYVYEKNLSCFATMPVVCGNPKMWMDQPHLGITYSKIVHGSQELRNFKPLPIGRPILAKNRVTRLVDKYDKGALIVVERKLFDKRADDLIGIQESVIFARADGNFGGTSGGAPAFDPVPQREPDLQINLPTRPSAALLYRLNGDRNPLHADPSIARDAGFPRPILHGLCTFGLAAVAIKRAFGDVTISRLKARFSSPVFPGETVSYSFWKNETTLQFRANIPSRNTVVLDNGYAEIGR